MCVFVCAVLRGKKKKKQKTKIIIIIKKQRNENPPLPRLVVSWLVVSDGYEAYIKKSKRERERERKRKRKHQIIYIRRIGSRETKAINHKTNQKKITTSNAPVVAYA